MKKYPILWTVTKTDMERLRDDDYWVSPGCMDIILATSFLNDPEPSTQHWHSRHIHRPGFLQSRSEIRALDTTSPAVAERSELYPDGQDLRDDPRIHDLIARKRTILMPIMSKYWLSGTDTAKTSGSEVGKHWALAAVHFSNLSSGIDLRLFDPSETLRWASSSYAVAVRAIRGLFYIFKHMGYRTSQTDISMVPFNLECDTNMPQHLRDDQGRASHSACGILVYTIVKEIVMTIIECHKIRLSVEDLKLPRNISSTCIWDSMKSRQLMYELLRQYKDGDNNMLEILEGSKETDIEDFERRVLK